MRLCDSSCEFGFLQTVHDFTGVELGQVYTVRIATSISDLRLTSDAFGLFENILTLAAMLGEPDVRV